MSDYGFSARDLCCLNEGGGSPIEENRTFIAGMLIGWPADVDMGKDVAFPWAGYTFSYMCNGSVVPGGVETDPDQGRIFIRPPQTLAPGRYPHRLTVARNDTGESAPVFDGALTITRN